MGLSKSQATQLTVLTILQVLSFTAIFVVIYLGNHRYPEPNDHSILVTFGQTLIATAISTGLAIIVILYAAMLLRTEQAKIAWLPIILASPVLLLAGSFAVLLLAISYHV